MITPAEQFRDEINHALAIRPYRTPQGEVVTTMVDVLMGYPGGSHDVPPAWIYQHDDSGLEMVFQFYENFTDFDLACKVINLGQYPKCGEGASVQFNSDYCVRSVPPYVVLVHRGCVTVRSAIARNKLINMMSLACPQAMRNVGLSVSFSSWPISIGTTEDVRKLLDRLFLYAYCVEQVKRTVRHESLLPLVT